MAQRLNQQLPVEIIKPVNGKSVLFSLLGIAVIVLFANFVAKWYLEKFTINRGDWLIREKWELLLNLKQPVDWLILGDSSCNQGVVPSLFKEKLNATAINLCTIGNMTSVNNAWMLETYIQRFGPPRNILIVHVYDVWNRPLQAQAIAKVPLQWDYWQQLEPKIELDWNSKFQIFLERYVPLYSSNQSLSTLLMSPVESFQTSKSFQLEKDGLMIWEEPFPDHVKRQKKEHINFTKNNNFNLSKHNQMALDKIIQLAEKYQFEVYLANSPIYENLYKNREFKAYFGEVQKTLRTYAEQNKQVHYILQEPITFPRDQMENADHIIYSAARIYTNGIISEIIASQKNNQGLARKKREVKPTARSFQKD